VETTFPPRSHVEGRPALRQTAPPPGTARTERVADARGRRHIDSSSRNPRLDPVAHSSCPHPRHGIRAGLPAAQRSSWSSVWKRRFQLGLTWSLRGEGSRANAGTTRTETEPRTRDHRPGSARAPRVAYRDATTCGADPRLPRRPRSARTRAAWKRRFPSAEVGHPTVFQPRPQNGPRCAEGSRRARHACPSHRRRHPARTVPSRTAPVSVPRVGCRRRTFGSLARRRSAESATRLADATARREPLEASRELTGRASSRVPCHNRRCGNDVSTAGSGRVYVSPRSQGCGRVAGIRAARGVNPAALRHHRVSVCSCPRRPGLGVLYPATSAIADGWSRRLPVSCRCNAHCRPDPARVTVADDWAGTGRCCDTSRHRDTRVPGPTGERAPILLPHRALVCSSRRVSAPAGESPSFAADRP
jgi:hypothetical protein